MPVCGLYDHIILFYNLQIPSVWPTACIFSASMHVCLWCVALSVSHTRYAFSPVDPRMAIKTGTHSLTIYRVYFSVCACLKEALCLSRASPQPSSTAVLSRWVVRLCPEEPWPSLLSDNAETLEAQLDSRWACRRGRAQEARKKTNRKQGILGQQGEDWEQKPSPPELCAGCFLSSGWVGVWGGDS